MAVLAPLGALLLTTACGTTVSPADRGALTQPGSSSGPDGLTSAGSGTGGLDGGRAGGQEAEPAAGTQPGGSGSAASADIGTSGTGEGAATRRGETPAQPGAGSAVTEQRIALPGVSATEIFVGISNPQNAGTANKALGGQGLDPGDLKKNWEAVIKDLNSRGGIAGRKVRPVYYDTDASSSSTSAAQVSQGACEHWTKDNKVAAVLSRDLGNQIVLQCAQQAGALHVFTDLSQSHSGTFRRYPNYYEATGLAVDRAARATVEGLAAQGYFRNAKTALITWDSEGYRAGVQNGILPALARAGVRLETEPYYVASPEDGGSLADSSAATKSAALRFAQLGIDRVIILDGPAGISRGGLLVLQFTANAETQNYRPRYGLNTSGGLSTIAPSVPKGQFNGAQGIGWEPVLDLAAADDPPARYSPARKRCLAVLAAGGVRPANRNAENIATDSCDVMWFLKQSVETAGSVVDRNSFRAAVERLGTSYASPLTFLNQFGPGRHDGVAAARPVAYVGSCNCFRYTGPVRRVQ